MSTHSLTTRLQALADSYKQTLALIQTLQKFPSVPQATTPDGEDRIELASTIHEQLKKHEDALDLLRQETDDSHYTTAPNATARWVGGGPVTRRHASEREQEHDRNATAIARLSEDLKHARGLLRRAQLQAKRNADAAKRKEREILFANRAGGADGVNGITPARRKGMEKLTQDELALNASNDVTAALRRTHDLMQGNLQQSQFAQQTLDESTAALDSLGGRYEGVGDLLKGSKGLVGQLLRSQKSDTWYLETAFYILVVTIGWLVFRRVLYGPLWWFIWLPVRWGFWLLATMLSTVGIIGGGQKDGMAVQSSVARAPGLSANGAPMNVQGATPRSMMLAAKGGGWGGPAQPPAQTPESEPESMAEKIGRMAEKIQDGMDRAGVNLEEISEDLRLQQESEPRNPKKRMMEVEPEEGERMIRDEL